METQHDMEIASDDMVRHATPASRSSSLSPPPSSLSDEIPTPAQSPFSERQDISLDNITISSPKSFIEQSGMPPTTRHAARKVSARDDSQESPKANKDASPVSKPQRNAKFIVKKIANKASRQKWTPERLLTDPKSPVARADIRNLLCNNPLAWDILTPEEKTEILALFPSETPILNSGTPDARPDMALLASDDNFRHDCARYAENLAEGKHDPQWLAEAWAASEQRRAGEFDEYLEAKFEEEWGVQLPDHMRRSKNRTAMTQASSQDSATSRDPDSQTAGNGPDHRNAEGIGESVVNGDSGVAGGHAATSPTAEGASPTKKQRIS